MAATALTDANALYPGLDEALHSIHNYYALLEQHHRLEAEIILDQTDPQRINALSGTLGSYIDALPDAAIDETKLAQVVKSKLPIRCTNIDNLVCDIKMKNCSVRAVARTFERRRRRIQRKINDNEADLEEFTNEENKYLTVRVPFKNAAAVRQFNTLRADLEYCQKKKQEYAQKLKETNEVLNSMVIDTTIDDDTTEESSIDD